MLEESSNPISPSPRSYSNGPRSSALDTAADVTDSALLARVRSGDKTAMETMFDRYSRVIYSVALRVLKDPGQAEDVMQDILIQIWRNPDSFNSGRGTLGTWLAVVSRNRAIDTLRRRRPVEAVDDVVLLADTDLASEAERNLLMERVRIIMRELPPDQKKSLELAYFEGLSHTEIAEQTGDPLGTVKTRIRLGLITLRKALRS